MSFNRVQLNSLIFHNQVMLPRTSPGFGEVSLAVAELQGGDPGKAAAFAEAAVAKDSHLAAGWLAKATADVFAANGANLRVERAMFCLERAFECAPGCRRDMTEFFVTNLLAHYLSLVCSAASAHLQEANRNEEVSSTAFGHARSLDFTALIAGITAFCAKRESTRIVSGLTAVAAYGEAAVQRNHALAHWDAADNHVTMATMHVEPAYQLLWIAGQMLKLESLPETLLGPMVAEFTRLLTGATDKQLERLRTTLEEPLWNYFNSGTLDGLNPADRALEAEYAKARGPRSEEEDRFFKAIRVDIDNQQKTGGGPAELKEKWGAEIGRFLRGLDAPHPHCQPLLDFLDRILPGVRETEAYQLLASPRTALARVIGPQAPIPDAPNTNLALSVVLRTLGYLGVVGLLFLGVMLVGVVGVASEHADDVVGSVVFAVLLVLVGVPFFLLVRWTRKRGKPIRAQEAVYRAQVEEHKKASRETEQRAKAPRERLARLVSDTFQRTRWGGVNDHSESTDRTIWSASAWLGERPEERIKARLFEAVEASATDAPLLTAGAGDAPDTGISPPM